MQRGPKVTGKWAQKFLDRIEEMSDGKDEIEEKTAVLEKEATAKPRRMPKMLAVVQAMKKHREDEINENPMLAKLLSLKKATTTTLCNWEPQWDNQLVCLYCDTPAIHNCIQCSYCDVVIHNSCLFEYASQIDEYVLHSADGKTFCCCDCMDAQVWHRTAVSGVYQKYKDDQQREDAALLITSNIREYVERKIKLEYVRAVVLLQAKYRCKYARDTFYRWRRNQYRVVAFELEQVLPLPPPPMADPPPSEHKQGTAAWRRERALLAAKMPAPVSPRLALLDGDPLSSFIDKKAVVVMTIVDAGKLVQMFRSDSLLLRALTSQAYLLPGLSCQTTAVFTIYVRTTNEIASQLPPDYLQGAPHIHSQSVLDHSKKGGSGQGPGGFSLNQVTALQYVPLLQGQIPLLFLQRFMYKQQIPVDFSNHIMWIPRDHKVDGSSLKISYNTISRTVSEHLLEARAKTTKRNVAAAVSAFSAAPSPNPMAASAPVPVPTVDTVTKTGPPVAVDTGAGGGAGKKVGFNFAAMARKARDNAAATTAAAPIAATPSLFSPKGRGGGAEGGGLFSPHTTNLLSTHTTDTAIVHSLRTTAAPNILGGSSLQSFKPPAEGAKLTESMSAARKAALTTEYRQKYHYTCLLNYTPMNPVVNLCCFVLGPRLAVLGRGPEAIDEGLSVRGWKWWLCIIQGKMYFYMYHGDSNPRFVSDVRGAELVVDENAPDVLVVKHADGRAWRLKFGEYFDLMRFKYALAEYQSLAAGEGSLYMPPGREREASSLKGFRNFGHRCKTDFREDEPSTAGAGPAANAGAGSGSGPAPLSPGGVVFSPLNSPEGPPSSAKKFFPK